MFILSKILGGKGRCDIAFYAICERVHDLALHSIMPLYRPLQGALSRGVHVPAIEIIARCHRCAMYSEVRERPEGLCTGTHNPIHTEHSEGRVDRLVFREHSPQDLRRNNMGLVVVISLQATIVGQAVDLRVANGELGRGTRAIGCEDGIGDALGQKCHDMGIIAWAV